MGDPHFPLSGRLVGIGEGVLAVNPSSTGAIASGSGTSVTLTGTIDEIKARYDGYGEVRSQAIRDMHDELVSILDGARAADDFHR